ncbi:Cytosolic enolase 3-like protein, partial [Drosera capensis]
FQGELGANAILAVSIAACKAGAAEKEVPLFKHVADLSGTTNVSLPVPAFTVISGGKQPRNNLAFQEIMVLPVGAKTFEEALQMGSDIYHQLEHVALSTLVLPSVQLVTSFANGKDRLLFQKKMARMGAIIREGLDLVNEAVRRTGLKEEIRIAINVAATDFCIGTTLLETNAPSPRCIHLLLLLPTLAVWIKVTGFVHACELAILEIASCQFAPIFVGMKYDIAFKSSDELGKNFKSAEDLIELYKELCNDYPIVSIEDPFDREDWEHTEYFSKLQMTQVAGGDLLMSNPKHIEKAIQDSTCNALLLKVNHVGTVSEAIEAVKLAKDAQWGVSISHGSGETEDTFIADLSVGLATGQIKAGAPCGGERLCKYNQKSSAIKQITLVKDGELRDSSSLSEENGFVQMSVSTSVELPTFCPLQLRVHKYMLGEVLLHSYVLV